MKGQSCTWGAEMEGVIIILWEPDNNIHLLSSAQIADSLELFE
jgi:hypothetical protein